MKTSFSSGEAELQEVIKDKGCIAMEVVIFPRDLHLGASFNAFRFHAAVAILHIMLYPKRTYVHLSHEGKFTLVIFHFSLLSANLSFY